MGAVVATLGAMMPVTAGASTAQPDQSRVFSAIAVADASMPAMDAHAMKATPMGGHHGCVDHPGHKSMMSCNGCAICAGAQPPAPAGYVGLVRFAEGQALAPAPRSPPVQSLAGQIERPPKANG